jgi:hypothetical protein
MDNDFDFSALFGTVSELSDLWGELDSGQQEQAISVISNAVDLGGGVSPGTDEESEFQRTGSRWFKIAGVLALAAKPLKVTAPPVALVVLAVAATMTLLSAVASRLTPEIVDNMAGTFSKTAPGAYQWLCEHPYALAGVAFFGGSPSAAVSVAMDLKAGERFYLLGRCAGSESEVVRDFGNAEVPGFSGADAPFLSVRDLNGMINKGQSSSGESGSTASSSGDSGSTAIVSLGLIGGLLLLLKGMK